jgi:hypothetical protein
MKANKAPEKIYVVDATFPDYVDFDGSPINTKRIDNHDIEFIRTDAFIEKACAWLDENLIYYWEQLNVDDTAELLDDFKNYMKGE